LSSKPGKPGLPLGDELRLEPASTIARDRDLDLAVIRQNCLRTRPLAAVALATALRIVLLVAKVLSQFRIKRPLNQGLVELFEKPNFPC